MYILKQIPEDFIVEEIPEKEFAKDKNQSYKYSVCLLTKTNYNTEDAVEEICRVLHLQRKNISYAGAKDRNAITKQYISILGNTRDIEIKDILCQIAGYSDVPLSLGSLKGNKFKITIRNLDDKEVQEIISNSKSGVFTNYFDTQRFSKNNAELGKMIMQKKYKYACELLMQEKSRNSELISSFLSEHKNAYLNSLKLIPKKTILILVHAYQSLLWNRAANEIAFKKTKIQKLPLLGFGTEMDGEVEEVYNKIMQDEGLTLRDFIIRDFPEISLEGDERNVYSIMENLNIGEAESDELNYGMKKIRVEFSLSKGAYATMAVRHLLGDVAVKTN